MNASFHIPEGVEVCASSSNPNLFSLKVRYAGCADAQYYRSVHIPESLRAALTNAPAGFHLELLQLNATPSRLLSGGPDFAVLGVVDRDGNTLQAVPREWVRYGRTRLVIAAVAAFAAVVVAFLAQGPQGALSASALSVLALWAWQRSQLVKAEPFRAFVQVG